MNQMTRINTTSVAGFGARFTTAEFLRMVDSGAFQDMKVELIEGALERMPPPGNVHALRQITLLAQIVAIVGAERVRAELGIDLGDDTLVACDGAVLHVPLSDDRMLTASDLLLVVEVAESTQRRDTEMKRVKYAGAGIPFYWVVDGKRSVIHVYQEPVASDYAQVATVRFGQPVTVPGTNATITLT